MVNTTSNSNIHCALYLFFPDTSPSPISPVFFNEISSLFCYHYGRSVGITRNHKGHDGCVHHTKSAHTQNSEII